MTNAMIVLWESVNLMEKGIIKGTGEFVTVEDKNGNKKQLELPEPIHTYAAWKKLGYQVKKGAKAVVQFPIWKYTVKKAKTEDEEDKTNMFMKTASFFTREQVDEIC